ncbi:zinc finger domain-containing protein [Mycolicibacterium parafortuitum]|uniref:zinc finger domain-containing protein n=1 Tax=Mycolicibacterium parafortuitum TaxID=39692 RepID=UPI003B8A5E33
MPNTHRRARLGDTTTDPASPAALTVTCPLCDARPGQPCLDAIRGWVREAGPHLTRVAAAVDPAGVRRGDAR